MFYISHRGNLNGRIPERENSPEYIMEALNAGYDVEIDVWYLDDSFWLGHDYPQYKVGYEFLLNEKLWCHAKNVDSLLEMKKYVIHYFWHENDTLTLTSKNYVWSFPRHKSIKNSIVVLPELYETEMNNIKGICSDYISNYKL